MLQEKSVALLGCGSIGSQVALALAKAGVGYFSLVDNEVLRVGNVVRHQCGLDAMGQGKAVSVGSEIWKRNPFCSVTSHNFSVTDSPVNLERIIKDADMIVSCIGRDAIEFFVNVAAAKFEKTTIYCRTHLWGKLGVVFVAQPSAACLQCLSCHLAEEDCLLPKVPEVPYAALVDFDADCGSAFIPASAIDMELVSVHCARICLSLLEGKKLEHNYFLIRGREIDEEVNLDSRIKEPFRIFSFDVTRHRNCPLCSLDRSKND